MESNRNSPLTTLIMVMPLIVVPALAILRPSEPEKGYVSDDLGAAQGVEFEEFEPRSGVGFSRLLDSPSPTSRNSGDRVSSAMNRLTAPLSNDWIKQTPLSLDAESSLGQKRTQNAATGFPRSTEHAAMLEALKEFGVTRTVWFQPGGTSDVGFVAFVPSDEDQTVSYRFEAIAATESDAVREVIRDLRSWQSRQPASSGP